MPLSTALTARPLGVLACAALGWVAVVGAGLWRGGLPALVALVVTQLVFLLGWRRQLIPAITRAAVVALMLAVPVQAWLLVRSHQQPVPVAQASQVVVCALAVSVLVGFVVQFARRPPRRAATVSLAAGVASALMCLLGSGWMVTGLGISAQEHQVVRLVTLAGVMVGMVVQGVAWGVAQRRRLRRARPLPRLPVAWGVVVLSAAVGLAAGWVAWRLMRAQVLALPTAQGGWRWAVGSALIGAGGALAGCAGVRVASMISFANMSAPRPSLRLVQRVANPLTRMAVGSSLAVLLAGVVVLAATVWHSRA